FFLCCLTPPVPTLFPYTTLFRSVPLGQRRIYAHAERVLKRAAAIVSEGKISPPVRSSTPIEVDFEGLWAEGDGRDLRCLIPEAQDRKSTRLNSSHVSISYAVFCL